MDASGRVHCVSPLLYESGRIPFTLSMDNGRSFPRSGTWLSGEPRRCRPDGGGGGHQAAPAWAGALTGTLPGDNLVEPVTLEACPGCGLPRLLSPPAGIHAGVPAQGERGLALTRGWEEPAQAAKTRAPPGPAPDLSYYGGTMAPQGAPDPLGPRPFLSPHLPAPRPVHPSKVSDSEKSQLVNETRWQYYGTPGTQGNLTLTWNTSALPSDAVTIELWGYEETGEASRGPSAAGVKPLTPTRSLELAEMGERRFQVGGIQPGISSRKVLAGRGRGPGYWGWRRCRRLQLLDTWLVLEIGKICPTSSSRSPWRASRPGPGSLPQQGRPSCAGHLSILLSTYQVAPTPTCAPGGPGSGPGADEAFPSTREAIFPAVDSSVVVPVLLGYQHPQLRVLHLHAKTCPSELPEMGSGFPPYRGQQTPRRGAVRTATEGKPSVLRWRERGGGGARGREGGPKRACVPYRDVQALWSNEHALAWHLGDDFRMDPVAWARNQCLAWEELEDQLPKFLEELPDCPCTLAQARADSGRFHVSPHPRQGPGVGEGQARAGCPHQ